MCFLVSGVQTTYAFLGTDISYHKGYMWFRHLRPIRIGGTPVIRTPVNIMGCNTVCVNSGATTFRMPAIADWLALSSSWGDYTTRQGGGCQFAITNLTGQALTIDITTNSGYTLWDSNTNTGFTVNKSVATGLTHVFTIAHDSSAANKMLVYYEGTMGVPSFS